PSPIAQRRASTRLDLPQPFGPTTPVRPGSISSSVASTNDLKPTRRSRVSFIKCPGFAALSPKRGPSALQKGFDFLLELLDRQGAAYDLPVDKESRRGIDPELLGGRLTHGSQVVLQLPIRQASLEALGDRK